jgi:hypothetical protein
MAALLKARWRNSDGTTSEHWQVEWRDANEKRRRRQFETLPEAKRFQATAELSLAAGPISSEGDVLCFKTAALEFIQSRIKLGREPSTWRSYDRHLRLHLESLIGEEDVRKLRRAQFLDLQE